MDASRAVVPRTQNLRLEDLSEIKVTFTGESPGRADRWAIVIMTCKGPYQAGIEGERDARFLRTMGEAAVRAWEPDAMILELSELDYPGGDDLGEIQFIGDQTFGNEGLPLAVVVGSGNEASLRKLFEPELTETTKTLEWIFRDMKSARDFVDVEIARLRGMFGRRQS